MVVLLRGEGEQLYPAKLLIIPVHVKLPSVKQSDMVDSQASVIRKRRKVIKSCLFCRKRKLKCDHKKPKCSTCAARNLPECVYVEKFTHEIDPDVFLSSTPNVELAGRIKELEAELATYRSNAHAAQSDKNPILRNGFLSQKNSGRSIMFGPTSFRQNVNSHIPKFHESFRAIWKNLKKERMKWKILNDYSTLAEISVIERSPINSSKSVIQAVCDILPSYEDIQQLLEIFFESNLFHSFQILDPQKVLRDFQQCFVRGPRNPSTGKSPVIVLRPTSKKNYYSIGVVTEILCLTYYLETVPAEIDTFARYLTSFVTAKVFYIERVQFFMLRYLYKSLVGGTGGDMSHAAILINLAATTAIHMGLYQNINELYKSSETFCGSIASLETLWDWILFADLEVAFALGVPLRISDEHFDKQLLMSPQSGTNFLFKKTVIKLRGVLRAVRDQHKAPDLRLLLVSLQNFVEENFKPLSFFLNPENLDGSELLELDLLFFSISMMCALCRLQVSCFKDTSIEIVNSCIQYTFIILSLNITTLERYFALDCIFHPDSITNSDNWISPYLRSGILLSNKHLPRCIMEIYTIIFDKAVILESRPITSGAGEDSSLKNDVFDLPLNSLRTIKDHHISLDATMRKLNSLTDQLLGCGNKEMAAMLANSYSFTISAFLLKMSREVLNTLSNRPKLNTTQVSTTTSKPSTHELNLQNLEEVRDVGVTDEMLNVVADEFWSNFETELNDWVTNEAEDFFSNWFKNDKF